MKHIIIAAALAVALPAFAAAETDKAPAEPQKSATTQPAKVEAPAKVEKQTIASEGISKDVTLVAGTAKPANGASKEEERFTLRFQSWVHDEDNQY